MASPPSKKRKVDSTGAPAAASAAAPTAAPADTSTATSATIPYGAPAASSAASPAAAPAAAPTATPAATSTATSATILYATPAAAPSAASATIPYASPAAAPMATPAATSTATSATIPYTAPATTSSAASATIPAAAPAAALTATPPATLTAASATIPAAALSSVTATIPAGVISRGLSMGIPYQSLERQLRQLYPFTFSSSPSPSGQMVLQDFKTSQDNIVGPSALALTQIQVQIDQHPLGIATRPMSIPRIIRDLIALCLTNRTINKPQTISPHHAMEIVHMYILRCLRADTADYRRTARDVALVMLLAFELGFTDHIRDIAVLAICNTKVMSNADM
ncbi:Bromodomain adjacent to zinc finger domain protein 2A [Colletotrichum trifolii]|uniref:Bromodomain adjacent to zinc finger domain protein 2A n=1 Tax=Colletotrichum trifolii TaxID=5466 RepID=A0A4R8RNE4_COLTR|nr:Bromodomain adjacent to zinc finger domain protein 2A [Colletotrichum trifolii]